MNYFALGLLLLVMIGGTACATPAATTTEAGADTHATPATMLPSSTTPTTPPPLPTATSAPTETPILEPTPSQEPAAPLGTLSFEQPLVVVFVEEGNVKLWAEETQQSKTIFSSGDVTGVTLSDDGQLIAFSRRSLRQGDGSPGFVEQSALWVVDRNGDNPRELISAEALRQRHQAAEAESVTIAEISWLPQTHHLIYSGMRYTIQGEGFSHSRPEGVYQVEAETGSTIELASNGSSLRFSPSPDGRQVALLSTTALSFIDVDGGNRRQNILTYPEAGAPLPIFPNGVWTKDAHAFIAVVPNESGPVLNLTLWRVPADGSPAQALATIADSHPASLTFAPTGDQAAYYHWEPEEENTGWFLIPLTVGAGSLALPRTIELGYANWHWSPANASFVFPNNLEGALFQLCPGATKSSEICGDPIKLGGTIAAISWLDDTRFLFVTRNETNATQTLSLGKLTGPITTIGTWAAVDQMPPDLQLKFLPFDYQQ